MTKEPKFIQTKIGLSMQVRINNWGFGDVILISNILLNTYPDEIFEISIGSGLAFYIKDDSHKKNIIKLCEIMLCKEKIIWHQDDIFTPLVINHQFIIDILQTENYKKTENLYRHNNLKISEDYIVLPCKIRDFSKFTFDKIKKNFFDKLNRQKNKIIIIGESFIDYSKGEYSIIGSDRVYSIYDEICQNIDNSKLMDFSFDGRETTNFSNFMRDINLIYNSKKTFMLGWGGIFCAGIFLNNFHSLFSWENPWVTLNGKVFTDENKFYKAIESV